jgi:hypothetical protein
MIEKIEIRNIKIIKSAGSSSQQWPVWENACF